jgi:two-component system sensor histidine kinase HydH
VSKTGVVRIASRLDEDGATVIEVIDDGKGIAPELKESIWKPLFTTKKRGTGLGLPIVVNIVGRHEGLVSFDSAPGKGTTFRVALPPREASKEPEPDRGGAVEL